MCLMEKKMKIELSPEEIQGRKKVDLKGTPVIYKKMMMKTQTKKREATKQMMMTTMMTMETMTAISD